MGTTRMMGHDRQITGELPREIYFQASDPVAGRRNPALVK